MSELINDITDLKFGPLRITDYIFDETVTVAFVRLKRVSLDDHFDRVEAIDRVEPKDVLQGKVSPSA